MIRASTVVAAGWSLLLLALVLLPVLLVALASVVDPAALGLAYDQSGRAGSDGPFAAIWTSYQSWWWYSLWLALAISGVAALLCLPAAWILVRHPFPGSRLLEDVVLLPVAVPGIAMSVALLAAWGSWRGGWLVGAGHLIYTLPFLLRALLISLRAGDLLAQDRVAASLGAGGWQRARWVLLPQLRGPLSAGLLLVAALSWGEFNVSYLLNAGHPQTFPAALYDTFANDSLAKASAAMVLFLAVLLPLVLVVQAIGGRQRVDQGA